MSYMQVSCGKCGAVADVDEFTRTLIGGDLPAGQFQCPRCRFAFQRVSAGGWKTFKAPNGRTMQVPDRIELKPCQARM